MNGQKLSKLEILDDIRKVASDLNKNGLSNTDYFKNGKYSEYPIKRLFGNIEVAIKEAGVKHISRVTKEIVIADIQKVAEQLGVSKLTFQQYDTHGEYSKGPLNRLFGSVAKALDAAGVSIGYVCAFSAQEVLDDIKVVAKKLNRSLLTWEHYSNHGKFSHGPIIRHFGSIRKAFKAAGLNFNGRETNWTKEELIQDISSVAKELKQDFLTCDQYKEHGEASIGTLHNIFGSVVNAFREAGIRCSERHTPAYSEEELLSLLKHYYKTHNLVPTSNNIKISDHYPTDKTYYTHFPGKTWAEILELVGLKSENQFLGLDKFYYQSRMELEKANLLYRNMITYCPHKKVCDERQWKCDFYLPNQDLWIEFDGLEDYRKDKHKYQEKIQYYQNNHFNFVQVYESDDLLEKCQLYIKNDTFDTKEITYVEARAFLSRVHYLGTAPKNSKYVGAFIKDQLVGVVGYGKTSNPKEKALAITRVAWLDIVRQHNFGSRFISRVIKHIRQSYEGPIVSFSDSRFHDGALYRACNFRLVATKSKTDYVYVDANGDEHHKSRCRVSAGQSEPEYARSLGLTKVTIPPKQKWIYS